MKKLKLYKNKLFVYLEVKAISTIQIVCLKVKKLINCKTNFLKLYIIISCNRINFWMILFVLVMNAVEEIVFIVFCVCCECSDEIKIVFIYFLVIIWWNLFYFLIHCCFRFFNYARWLYTSIKMMGSLMKRVGVVSQLWRIRLVVLI